MHWSTLFGSGLEIKIHGWFRYKRIDHARECFLLSFLLWFIGKNFWKSYFDEAPLESFWGRRPSGNVAKVVNDGRPHGQGLVGHARAQAGELFGAGSARGTGTTRLTLLIHLGFDQIALWWKIRKIYTANASHRTNMPVCNSTYLQYHSCIWRIVGRICSQVGK